MRDIQLRKQLEERVKEATKNRQQAEKEMAEAGQVLSACKAIDADTREADEALAEATTAISAKDYKLALDKSIEAKEKAKRAYAQRANAIVDSSAGLLNIVKNMGVNTAEGDTALGKARESLAKEDYPTAIDIAQKNWKKFEKVVHEHLARSFTSAQSLIMTAKALEKDTAAVEDLLSRARNAVESNDYELALGYTNECLETIRGELIEEVVKATADVEILMKTAQELGIDVAKMSSLVERSKADADKQEFQKAINTLKQAKAEGDRSLQKGLDTRIAEANKMMQVAVGMGADTTACKALMEQANAAVKEGNFQHAAELGKKALQEIQAAQFQRVLITIASSRDKFVSARNIGADITPAMELLNRARQALQKGSFVEALDCASAAEREADKALGQFHQVESTVKELGKDFIDAEAVGVNTGNARRFLERAKKDINARDFASGLEEVRKAKEELARSEYERTMEVMEQSEFVMTLGERMGAPLEEAQAKLEECIIATKEKHYKTAIELARSASQMAENAIKNQLTDTLAMLRSSMVFLAEDAASVRSLVDKAEGAMAARDYDGAFTFVSEARKFVEGKTRSKAEEFHSTLKTAVELGAELGAAVGALAETFKQADAALERGDTSKIMSMNEIGRADLTAVGETVFNLIKDKLIEARNLRINIEDLLQILKRARMSLSKGEMYDAFRLMSECNARTGQIVSMHRDTYNAISSAAALVAEAKKKDVDVASVLEMLLESKKAFERLDYERALELARKSKLETQKLMILYSSAQNIIAAKEKLDIASRLDVDTANLRESLELAKEAMKNKSYEEALSLSTKTQVAIDELIENKIRILISQSETILDAMRDTPLTELRGRLNKARESLDKRDWGQSGELAAAIREELERTIKTKEEVGVAIKRCHDMISEVEALNIETPNARKLLEKSEKDAKMGSYNEALVAAQNMMTELEKERDSNVSKTIERFQDAVNKAKRDGIDTRTADKLLEKSREQFREGRYRQALALAMQSEAEAERIGLQQDMAAKAIMTAEKKLKSLTVPMPEVTNMITGAQRAFEEGDYVKALDLAIRAGDGFNKIRELVEEINEVKVKAEKITASATTIGADSSSLQRILNEANMAFSSGDPRASRDVYQQCVESGVALCRSHLEQLLAHATRFAEGLKILNIDGAPIMRRLAESKAHIDSENFEAAFRLLEGATIEAKTLMSRLVTDALAASESALEHAKGLKADVGEAEKLLAEARKALDEGRFDTAMRFAMESVTHVESRREFEKKFIDFSYKADSTIRNARKYGIDVAEAEKRLVEALKVKRTDLDKAIEIAEQAFKMAGDAVDAFAPKMEARLDISSAEAAVEMDATLTLMNTGKALAKDVRLKIIGDAEVQGLEDQTAVRAKGEVKIPLKIKMKNLGAVPLAVQIISHRVLDGKEYFQEVIAMVDVVERMLPPPPPPPPPQTIQQIAQGEGRCQVCKGSIKAGFRISVCPSCRKEFHEMCASRIGKCPGCGIQLAS